jgi:hypothetical protein
VIKEIPVMTTTTTDTRAEARGLALSLVQVLALGLPGPGYITVNPDAAHSRFVAAIDLQFDGDGEAAAVYESWVPQLCSALVGEFAV